MSLVFIMGFHSTYFSTLVWFGLAFKYSMALVPDFLKYLDMVCYECLNVIAI